MRFFSVCFTCIALTGMSVAFAEDAQIADLFDLHGVDGTMVIASIDGRTSFVHNDKRAEQRLSAASTFKILNSLIALDEGIVENAQSIIKWDGTVYEYPSWNQDQTLKSAYQVSCVWCYQTFARQVGSDKYRTYLTEVNYGHLKDSFNLTTFWLDNGLTVSTHEQISLLKNVHDRVYPFSDKAYVTLSEIMLETQTDAFSLRAKTGWAARVSPQVGWYVGYIQTEDNTWFFATNLHIREITDLPLRKQLTLQALRLKGIIEDTY